MRYVTTLIQFFYSQHAFTSLRTLLGVVLPPCYVLAMSGDMTVAIGLALGAFCISLVDIPEPLWRKPLRMLAATLIFGVGTAAITLVMDFPVAAWLVLLTVAFCAGLAVVYGLPGTLMGLCALVGVDLMLAQHDAGGALWSFLEWMMLGALWYTAFSTAACALFPYQIARRAVAESLMEAARHLRQRAEYFVPDTPLDQCHRDLADVQSAVVDAQQVARNVVLGSLAVSRLPNRNKARLFDMLIRAIDLHDASLALHGDFARLRAGYAGSRAPRLIYDILRTAAQRVEDLVPSVVLGRTPAPPAAANEDRGSETSQAREASTGIQALPRESLRALARELRTLEARGLDTAPLRAFQVQLVSLADTLDRLWRHSDAGAASDTDPDACAQPATRQADIDTAVRIYHRTTKWTPPWRAVRESPIGLRYALRLTLAIALGTLIAKWIGGHGTWVILTIMIVMSPSFGANQQRSRQRIAGTLLGCVGAAVLIWCGVKAPWLLATLIIASYAACFALARPTTYVPSVFFCTIAVLLLYHLLVPGWSMIEQRGLDTLIGGTIGALGAFVFPAWEHLGLDAKLAAARQACRCYAAAVFVEGFDMSRYRVARRDALDAIRSLAASHQRMLLEPRAKRHRAVEIAAWLSACHLMIAALAALGQWRRSNGGAALPLSSLDADMVDEILDGARQEGGKKKLPALVEQAVASADLPAQSGAADPAARGENRQPFTTLTALQGAAQSMARANARLAGLQNRRT